MKNTWTGIELETLLKLKAEGKTAAEIGTTLGRSQVSVERKADYLKKGGNAITAAEPAAPVTEETKKAGYWREECQRLNKQLAKLSKQQTVVDVLCEEVRALAPTAYTAAPTIAPARGKNTKHGTAQSAMLLLSDTHVGAVVRPSQTLGFGQYDFATFLRRLKRVEDSVVSILADHTTTPVDELIVPMIGDMIDGALSHAAEVGQVNTLFSQFYGAGHALAQFLRNLSALVPKVRIYTCVGNHPRWQNQHKMPTKNRFSNLDQFLYAYIQALVRDIPKIEFNLNQQPYAEFKVYGYNFLAAHGDHLKGGDAALGIPAHALGRAVSAGSQLRAKTGRPGVNYYLLGHLHRSMELPHAQGEIVVNGGFPGVDEFGLSANFSAVDPVQKFFLVHPKFGRTACYDLNLKFAATDGPMPYTIPNEFPIL